MLLDTTVLIDLMRNDSSAHNCIRAAKARGIKLIVTSGSIHELFVGITQSNNPEQEQSKVQLALTDTNVLPLHPDLAEQSGRIDGNLRSKGIMIGVVDCVTAATAIEQNVPLLTRNVKHFKQVAGLKVETY